MGIGIFSILIIEESVEESRDIKQTIESHEWKLRPSHLNNMKSLCLGLFNMKLI